MTTGVQSKILSIEEQIKKLQEKKKREVAKLERNAGKKLLEKFDLHNSSLEEIYTLIDSLAVQFQKTKEEIPQSGLNNEQSNI